MEGPVALESVMVHGAQRVSPALRYDDFMPLAI